MSDFKGTSGPWVADGFDIFSEDMDAHVCIISSWLDEEIEDANASLIAAAPELLEALQEVVKFHFGKTATAPAYLKAQAAIAKALGQ